MKWVRRIIVLVCLVLLAPYIDCIVPCTIYCIEKIEWTIRQSRHTLWGRPDGPQYDNIGNYTTARHGEDQPQPRMPNLNRPQYVTGPSIEDVIEANGQSAHKVLD